MISVTSGTDRLRDLVVCSSMNLDRAKKSIDEILKDDSLSVKIRDELKEASVYFAYIKEVVNRITDIRLDDQVQTYKKKPVQIQAMQWTGSNTNAVMDFCPAATCRNMYLVIPTLEGDMLASPGDFIIKGVLGEYYPCKPDAFKKTYDRVDE